MGIHEKTTPPRLGPASRPVPASGAPRPLRALELFCGIGGAAAAMGTRADIVAAVDINQLALSAYRGQFSHPARSLTIEGIPAAMYRDWRADLWWLSPPCQPYTCRGKRRDLDDPRAQSLRVVIRRIGEVQPRYVALENVPGFAGSRAHAMLAQTLAEAGYSVRERLLCPTELGVPNFRRRFYLVAARGRLLPWRGPVGVRRQLAEYVDARGDSPRWLSREFLRRYRGAIHIADPSDPHEVAHCFTSAYGRSHIRCGSYLAVGNQVRRFAPYEILRLLGFPAGYALPSELNRRQSYALVGNSLSVCAVREVLSAIPELAEDEGPAER